MHARGIGCLVVGVALVVAAASSAQDGPTSSTEGTELLRNRGGQSARYTGIGQLDGPRTCTAWVVATVPRAPS